MIWIEWIVKHWKTVGVIAGVAVFWISLIIVLKPQDAREVQPTPPVVQVVKVDTTQTSDAAVIESKHDEKRRVKVRVIVPPSTVIGGDSAMVIEVVVEDSSKSEAAVEDVKVVDRGLTESITVAKQEVVPVKDKERLIGVIAGAGYLPDGGALVPEVGVSLHLYKLVYAQGGVGLDGVVFGFGGGALKIGEVLGFRILLGGNYSTESKFILSLSLGG